MLSTLFEAQSHQHWRAVSLRWVGVYVRMSNTLTDDAGNTNQPMFLYLRCTSVLCDRPEALALCPQVYAREVLGPCHTQCHVIEIIQRVDILFIGCLWCVSTPLSVDSTAAHGWIDVLASTWINTGAASESQDNLILTYARTFSFCLAGCAFTAWHDHLCAALCACRITCGCQQPGRACKAQT